MIYVVSYHNHFDSVIFVADCVEFLLKAGCSVDSSDNDGATSLHFAAARNHVEVCSLLISAKADVNSLVTTDQVKK
jgi:ankyrin repeat protein